VKLLVGLIEKPYGHFSSSQKNEIDLNKCSVTASLDFLRQIRTEVFREEGLLSERSRLAVNQK
jgi:hypothetical protein